MRWAREHRAGCSLWGYLSHGQRSSGRHRGVIQDHQQLLRGSEVAARQSVEVGRGSVGADLRTDITSGSTSPSARNFDVWAGALGCTTECVEAWSGQNNAPALGATGAITMPWRKVLKVLGGWREPDQPVRELEHAVDANAKRIERTSRALERLDERVELFNLLNQQRRADEGAEEVERGDNYE